MDLCLAIFRFISFSGYFLYRTNKSKVAESVNEPLTNLFHTKFMFQKTECYLPLKAETIAFNRTVSIKIICDNSQYRTTEPFHELVIRRSESYWSGEFV